jgi:hypothetical protein
MPVRVQVGPLLRKAVPGYDLEKGIVLDQANGQTVLQVMEGLNLRAEEISYITHMVNSCPGKPKSVALEAGCIILTKRIGGGRTAHADDMNTRRNLWT